MAIERIRRTLFAAPAIAALFAVAGCSTEAARPAQAASAPATHTDSEGGLVIAPSAPYVTSRGGPAGLVINLGATPAATPPPVDGTCEVASTPTPSGADAVVWVDGIRAGKPLSRERRYQLVSSGCALSPRIQGVLIGGAINVYNDDRVLHRLVFIRAGTNDTLQTIPFTNDNEVVATDRLTRTAGIVEVRCAQHPQERAYIAVFDHPYFGVASAGQTVSLDSIPAGDYQILSWREGMPAPVAVATKVATNGQTQVVVK